MNIPDNEIAAALIGSGFIRGSALPGNMAADELATLLQRLGERLQGKADTPAESGRPAKAVATRVRVTLEAWHDCGLSVKHAVESVCLARALDAYGWPDVPGFAIDLVAERYLKALEKLAGTILDGSEKDADLAESLRGALQSPLTGGSSN